VVKCLVHPDKNIRKIAIQTLKEICGANTASVVAERLEAEDEEMQLFILEALQQIGTEKENSVLSKYLFHSRDDFKVAAAKAIGNIDVDGWSYIEHKINPGASPWNVLLPYLKQESLS
jgi:HEAT repeat protein